MSTVIGFGKHKGKTVDEVAQNDLGYLKWLCFSTGFNADWKVYNDVMALKAKHGWEGSTPATGLVVAVGDCQTVSFGKYKGQSAEVMLADRGYCEWVLKQEWFLKHALYARVKAAVSDPQLPSSALPRVKKDYAAGVMAWGKYEGQPESAVLADRDYCQTLMRQEWFQKNRLFSAVQRVANGETGVTAPVALSGPVSVEELVQFKKYAGQPLSKVLADTGYCRWLLTQDWFQKHRYHEIVVKTLAALPESSPSSSVASEEEDDEPQQLDDDCFDPDDYDFGHD